MEHDAQPTGWVQISIGIGIAVIGFGVSYLVPREWASFVGWLGVALGLAVVLSALIMHYIRRQIEHGISVKTPRATPQLESGSGFLDQAGELDMRNEADAAFNRLSLSEKCVLRVLLKRGPLSAEDLVTQCEREKYHVRPLLNAMESASPTFLKIDRVTLHVACSISTRYRKYLAEKLL